MHFQNVTQALLNIVQGPEDPFFSPDPCLCGVYDKTMSKWHGGPRSDQLIIQVIIAEVILL